MPSVSEYFSILGLRPDAADFAAGNKLLDSVIDKAGQVGAAVAAAFAVDAIVNFAVATLDAIPGIGDLADQTGFASEEIQRLGFAAVQSGSDAETLNASLLKLTKNIGEAQGGSESLTKAFTAVGVSTQMIKRGDPTEIFNQIANGLSKVEGAGDRAAKASALFGRAGATMAPFLAQGADAIALLGDEAQRLGIVLSDSTIRDVGEVDDRIKALEATFSGLRRGLVVSALPAIEAIVKGLGKVAAFTARAIEAVKRFEKPIKAVGVALTLLATGAAVKWLVTLGALAIGQLAAAASNSTLTASYGILAGAIDIAALSAGRFLIRLAALALPAIAVGLAAGVIVLAIDDIITTLQGGDSFFGSFAGRFDEIAEALYFAAGDDGLGFFQRALAGVGVVFAAVFGVVDKGFEIFFDQIGKIADLGEFIRGLFTDPVETLRSFFTTALADFSAFVGKAAEVASKIANYLGNAGPTGVALAGPLKNFAAAAATVTPSTVSGAVLSSPVIRAAVDGRSSSNNVTVGAPAVNVTITGVSDPAAAAAAVNSSTGPALEQTLRAAAVDLIPGAG